MRPFFFFSGEMSPLCSSVAYCLVINLLFWQGRCEFESLLGKELIRSYSFFPAILILNKWTNLGEANEMGKVPLPAYLTSLCRVQHVFWVYLPDGENLAGEMCFLFLRRPRHPVCTLWWWGQSCSSSVAELQICRRSKVDICVVYRWLQGKVVAEIRDQGLWFWSWKHQLCWSTFTDAATSLFSVKAYQGNITWEVSIPSQVI